MGSVDATAGKNAPQIRRPRRIVTGHDDAGRSVFLMDGPAPNLLQPAHSPNVGMCDLWETSSAPADISGCADAADRPVRLSPPERGSVFRIVEFPPDAERNWQARHQVFAQYGEAHALDPGEARHPGFHKTRSIDYAIVLEGEIWALMDVGEALMTAGDVLVQRGTNHAWANRSEMPCRMAFVLIDAALPPVASLPDVSAAPNHSLTTKEDR
jgi:hypothetical protein